MKLLIKMKKKYEDLIQGKYEWSSKAKKGLQKKKKKIKDDWPKEPEKETIFHLQGCHHHSDQRAKWFCLTNFTKWFWSTC